MIQIESWAAEFAQKLQKAFGQRLLFLGYQGSYGRGEATDHSDIDIVTVLDQAAPADLDQYRELVRSMPQGELACGFLCGREELAGWPRYDSLGLLLDTKPVVGDLRELLPEFTREDVWEALKIGASGLYHAACHTYLYGGNPGGALAGLGKAAFFCLRFWALCRDGHYYPSKRELAGVLSGRERDLLRLTEARESGEARSPEEIQADYALLLDWAGEILKSPPPWEEA